MASLASPIDMPGSSARAADRSPAEPAPVDFRRDDVALDAGALWSPEHFRLNPALRYL
jgi:hypothetical protein